VVFDLCVAAIAIGELISSTASQLPWQHGIGQIAMSSIETEGAVQEINFRSNLEQHTSTIWRKGVLVRDFEYFNFLD
jgi:hypothetical protein